MPTTLVLSTIIVKTLPTPFMRVFKRGFVPLFKFFPLMLRIHLHIMERGTKGVRMIHTLIYA
jgi:hypothetical protein